MPRKPKKLKIAERYFTWLLGLRDGVYYADGRTNRPSAGRHSLGTKDYEQALEWYRKAAAQNYPFAQNSLGVMYQYGVGVTKDYEQALEWYRKAAARGYPVAEKNIGLLYLNGWGVPRDRQEAIKWLRQAAAHGDPDAVRDLERLGIKQ